MGEALNELAKQALATYSAEVSTPTKALRRTLDGPEGMSLIEKDERLRQIANDNWRMVAGFAALLPAVTWTDRSWYFRTGEQSQAKLLQASVLWRQYSVHSRYSATEKPKVHYPYYVVGRRLTKEEPQELLLVAAKPQGVDISDKYRSGLSRQQTDALDDAPDDKQRLLGRVVTSGQLRTYDALVQRGLGKPYSPEEADHWVWPGPLYDRKRHIFTVQGESPGSIAADTRFESSNSWLSNLLHKGAIQDAEASPLTDYVYGLSMNELLDFDVLGKMGQLAVRFDIEKETEKLFDSNPALSSFSG